MSELAYLFSQAKNENAFYGDSTFWTLAALIFSVDGMYSMVWDLPVMVAWNPDEGCFCRDHLIFGGD